MCSVRSTCAALAQPCMLHFTVTRATTTLVLDLSGPRHGGRNWADHNGGYCGVAVFDSLSSESGNCGCSCEFVGVLKASRGEEVV